jgi:hypothetical protein
MNPLSASDVFLTVAIMSVTFLTEGRAFHFDRNALKGALDLGNAQLMRGLGLRMLDG